MRRLTRLSDWGVHIHTEGILEDGTQKQEEPEHKKEVQPEAPEAMSLEENERGSSSKAFTTQQIQTVEKAALSHW